MTETRTWSFASDDEANRFRDERLDEVARFLRRHLDAYGDPEEHIRSCLCYASSRAPGRGGTVTEAFVDGELAGVVVTNRTGMGGYIPENILVYIAVDGARRGQGVGGTLLDAALGAVEGGVALHVEPDNPARRLYEKFGFTNKYLEMRLAR